MEWSYSHPAYARIAALFTARTGILCAKSRLESIEAGIKRAQAAAQLADPWEYLDRLSQSETLLTLLTQELAIGETYFFRETEQLQTLRSAVLPALISRLGAGQRLRIWSAGCSSGEEPYSVAMLLDLEGWLDRADILATDLNPQALERARSGMYREWSLRGLAEPMRRRYFQATGGHLTLIEHIRESVRFALHNLISNAPPDGAGREFDLIICRNVVIYFALQTVKEVAERFYQYLARGGWLLMGAADAPLWDFAPFPSMRFPGCILYGKEEAQVAPLQAPHKALVTPTPKSTVVKVAFAETERPPNGHSASDVAQAALAAVFKVTAQHGIAQGLHRCGRALSVLCGSADLFRPPAFTA